GPGQGSAPPDGRAPQRAHRGVEVIPALMFPHSQGQAGVAARQYVELFDRAFGDSGIGEMSFYPAQPGQEPALLQGFIRLAGQELTLMDSGVLHPFTFSMGVSLTIQCATQEQVDLLWEGLSAVPEAEACGWLKDRFGISWTITPENMTELIGRPGAWQTMAAMTKPTLSDFR
ncbi:VOC family protein, partial [Actinomyces slackii]|uniref:VOC family protein n=1 Tax=Actinomyces slackii TaxID=52774 RepID=UPI0039EA3859